ncbi:MAG: Flp/Fap pilin component [Actinomycetota bacterium]|jgi:pilus assembly protein Flp/PilA|nr:Flp/Fap pilin component [Actinomycetota bacterium]
MDVVGCWRNLVVGVRLRFDRDEKGAALVEYALLLALIAAVCILALTTLGAAASSRFASIADRL